MAWDANPEGASDGDSIARRGNSMVVQSGGEPTSTPELLESTAHVARLGMDFGLVTLGGRGASVAR